MPLRLNITNCKWIGLKNIALIDPEIEYAAKPKNCSRVFGVRAQIRRAYGSPGGRGAMHLSEIGV